MKKDETDINDRYLKLLSIRYLDIRLERKHNQIQKQVYRYISMQFDSPSTDSRSVKLN